MTQVLPERQEQERIVPLSIEVLEQLGDAAPDWPVEPEPALTPGLNRPISHDSAHGYLGRLARRRANRLGRRDDTVQDSSLPPQRLEDIFPGEHEPPEAPQAESRQPELSESTRRSSRLAWLGHVARQAAAHVGLGDNAANNPLPTPLTRGELFPGVQWERQRWESLAVSMPPRSSQAEPAVADRFPAPGATTQIDMPVLGLGAVQKDPPKDGSLAVEDGSYFGRPMTAQPEDPLFGPAPISPDVGTPIADEVAVDADAALQLAGVGGSQGKHSS